MRKPIRVRLLAVLVLVVALATTACTSPAVPTPTTKPATPALTPAPAAPTSAPAAPAAAPTSAPAGATAAAAPAKAAAQPKDGGTFTIMHQVDGTTGTLDAVYGGTSGFNMYFDNVYQSLFTRDRNTLQIIPNLAEKYEIAPDGMAVTLYLRQGVKWHNVPPVNGREFTSADVKWTLEKMRDTQPPSAFAGATAAIKDIQTPDKYTAKLLLKEPNAPLIFWLANSKLLMYPRELQETYGDKQTKAAIGTGPFMFQSYEPKQSVTLVKNPDYYEKGLPHLDTFKIVMVSDAAARLAALRSGQVDAFYGLAPTDVDSLKRTNPDLQSYEHFGLAFYNRLNVTKKPFDDIRVRQALNLAIDRPAVIKLAADGKGDVMGWMQPDAVPYAESTADLLKRPGFRQPKDADIAQAKKLLTEAGYPNGVSFEAQTQNDPQYIKAHEVMKELLKPVGFDVNVKVLDYNVLLNNLLGSGDYQFIFMTNGFQGDPDTLWNSFYSKGSINKNGSGSPEFDQLLLKQRTEMDSQKRLALFKQIETQLYDNLWAMPMYYSTQYLVSQKHVREFTPVPGASILYFGYTHKYVWLDK